MLGACSFLLLIASAELHSAHCTVLHAMYSCTKTMLQRSPPDIRLRYALQPLSSSKYTAELQVLTSQARCGPSPRPL